MIRTTRLAGPTSATMTIRSCGAVGFAGGVQAALRRLPALGRRVVLFGWRHATASSRADHSLDSALRATSDLLSFLSIQPGNMDALGPLLRRGWVLKKDHVAGHRPHLRRWYGGGHHRGQVAGAGGGGFVLCF